MADKYLQGLGTYHLVTDGKDKTKCGAELSYDRKDSLTDTKAHGGWPTCSMCALGLSDEELAIVRPTKTKK
jgi:hypothetical protein